MNVTCFLKLSLLGSAALLCACTTMSGYDAKDSFSCKAPDGVLCSSMTGIYANAMQGKLPGQLVNQRDTQIATAVPARMDGVMTQPIHTGTPIRSAPRILRMWFAPWEDSDGDLHDQSYVYLPVDAGKWQIEHTQRRIQDAYKPIRPPVGSPAGATTGAVPSGLSNAQIGAAAGFGTSQTLPNQQSAIELMESMRPIPGATSPVQ